MTCDGDQLTILGELPMTILHACSMINKGFILGPEGYLPWTLSQTACMPQQNFFNFKGCGL